MTLKSRVTRIAAYGLVLENQKILLCRLSDQVALDAGLWTLPGGGIDFGEDPAKALIRELWEETGLKVKPRGLAGIDSFYNESDEREFHSIRVIYHAELLGGDLRYELEGSTDFCAWWTLEEAEGLPLVKLAEIGLDFAFGKG